jgi:NTP pyrophosphatase (non-canonical NTP hydrolase)
MKEQYRPTTVEAKLGWVTEECGEVLAAIGKTNRWGLNSVNPELPRAQQETNRAWILRELGDLKEAIRTLEEELTKPITPCDTCGGNGFVMSSLGAGIRGVRPERCPSCSTARQSPGSEPEGG